MTDEKKVAVAEDDEGIHLRLHIVGLSDLWLAWIKPNRMAARAVAEVLSTFLTPENAVGMVKEALETFAGPTNEDPNKAVKGLADRVLKLMATGEHDRVVQLCKLVLQAP